VIVDQQGTVYVTDHLNNRVMRWFKGATEGDIIAGGKGDGEEAYQVSQPNSLAFDSQGNLYVVERGNSRAQRFDIDSTS
jgi:sugar lactone lactonase YvrE